MRFLWELSTLRTPFLEGVFSFITAFGEELVAIALLCLLFWCIDKELTYRIGFAYFLAGIAVQGMKITFRIDRPWILDPSFRPVDSALETATGYSFPSGHTQSAACLYGTLATRAPQRGMRVCCVLLALLVGFSRMFLGVHTPLDVVTALVISAVVIALSGLYFERLARKAHADALACGLFLAISAALALYALSLYSAGTIEFGYAVDCFKTAGAGAGFAAGFYIERRFIRFNPRAARFPVQVVKYFAGLAGAIALKSGLKPLFGAGLVADAFRYALVVLWIIALYPLLIKKYMSGKQEAPEHADA